MPADKVTSPEDKQYFIYIKSLKEVRARAYVIARIYPQLGISKAFLVRERACDHNYQ